MKKKIIFILSMASIAAFAQTESEYYGRIGVNTVKPKATMDINSIEADKAKGLLIPRITGDEIKAMTENLTEEQNSLLVFATEKVTTADKATKNISEPMYYRFRYDKTTTPHTKIWVKWEPTGLERIVNTNGDIGYRFIDYDIIKYDSDNKYDFFILTGLEIGQIGAGAMDMGTYMTKTNGLAKHTVIKHMSSELPLGATGKLSFNFGNYNSVQNDMAYALGGGNTIHKKLTDDALEEGGIAIGYLNEIDTGFPPFLEEFNNFPSISIGNLNTVVGLNSMALGVGNNVYNGVALGNYSTNPTTDFSKITNFRTFVLGNGIDSHSNSTRSDAFTVLGNGITTQVGINIDNFETTSSTAKLQINGSTLIGSFSKIDSFHNTIDQAPNSTTMLNVLGSIKIGHNENTAPTEGQTCDEPGKIAFHNDNFYGCKSTGWVKLNP